MRVREVRREGQKEREGEVGGRCRIGRWGEERGGERERERGR